MNSSEITFVILLVSIPVIAGLSCLTCQHFSFNTDNQTVKDQFSSNGLTENTACKDAADIQNTATQCSGATTGQIDSCAYVIGSGSAVADSGQSVDFTYNVRGCDHIPESKKGTCEDKLPILPINVTKLEGRICYCSTDNCNGQKRLVPTVTVFFLNLVVICILKE